MYYAEMTQEMLLRNKLSTGVGYTHEGNSIYYLPKEYHIKLIDSDSSDKRLVLIEDLIDYLRPNTGGKRVIIPNVSIYLGHSLAYIDIDCRNRYCLDYENRFFTHNLIALDESILSDDELKSINVKYYLSLKKNCIVYNGVELEDVPISFNYDKKMHNFCMKVVGMSKDGRDLYLFTRGGKKNSYPMLYRYRDGKYSVGVTSRVASEFFKDSDIEGLWDKL